MKLRNLLFENKFKTNLENIIQYLENSGYKNISSNDNSLNYVKHSRNEDSTFLIQYEPGHPAEDYYVNLQTKLVISSTSLADPRAAYQTTSARRVRRQTKKTVDYVDTIDKVKKLFIGHLKKIGKNFIVEQEEEKQGYWQQSRDKTFQTQQTEFDPETGTVSWDVEFTPLSALQDSILQVTEHFKDTLRKHPNDSKLDQLYSKFIGFKKAFTTHMNRKYNV